jgi:hypothetical protein
MVTRYDDDAFAPDELEGEDAELRKIREGRTFLTVAELDALPDDAWVTDGEVCWISRESGMFRESETNTPVWAETIAPYGVWQTEPED